MGQKGHMIVQKGLKMHEKRQKIEFLDLKNTIKAGGSTATKMSTGWMDGWIPLRLLRLLEHLAVLKMQKKPSRPESSQPS